MREIPNCIERTGVWLGVVIPRGVRVFDCRAEDGEIFSKAHKINGRYLWGTDRVSCALYGEPDRVHSPVSVTGCGDFRRADDQHVASTVRAMIRAFRDQQRDAVAKRSGAFYYTGEDPVAVELNNYGWSVITKRGQ